MCAATQTRKRSSLQLILAPVLLLTLYKFRCCSCVYQLGTAPEKRPRAGKEIQQREIDRRKMEKKGQHCCSLDRFLDNTKKHTTDKGFRDICGESRRETRYDCTRDSTTRYAPAETFISAPSHHTSLIPSVCLDTSSSLILMQRRPKRQPCALGSFLSIELSA